MSHVPAAAAPLPSLFRGVVVADGRGGVRVVSVEERSQAFLADLRPEDLILRINEMPTSRIEQFATVSQLLKGHQAAATLLVMRSGELRDIILHLFSYPVLTRWKLAFVPDFDLRFGDPSVGREYWTKLAHEFQAAGRRDAALNALLNALHNDPESVETAWLVSEALWDVSEIQLGSNRMADALGTLRNQLTLLDRLFDEPLEEGRLRTLKLRLSDSITSLKKIREGIDK